VGSVFRTCDAAGVSKLYLCGYTPTPVDRFGRKRKDVAKVSLGAEETVPWEHSKSIFTLIKKLKKDKVQIVAVEQDKKSEEYTNLKMKKSTAFLFGNEVSGLPKKILNEADDIVEISMNGKKESLNVSVAVGIILFGIQQ